LYECNGGSSAEIVAGKVASALCATAVARGAFTHINEPDECARTPLWRLT